ncbi:MAG: glycogen synthase [Patescibacteria group bacterium]|nr:glycogen synthase [Patescibacteria group bacterium]
MKVLFVSAEVAPFSSFGGLAQVSYFLPRALLKRGLDIRIFTPKYGQIDAKRFPTKMEISGLRVPTGEEANSEKPKELVCNVLSFATQKKMEPTVYLLENMEYYEKRANVYGYNDDHIRFGLLSRGALEFVRTSGFEPDLIHLNDWHTGYLANYLREAYKNDPLLGKIALLFTIHNLYQGIFDFAHASEMDADDGKGKLSGFFTDRFYKQNALKRGVIYSDLVNTVSETYAKEIMKEEFGSGLNNLFRELRGKVVGVLNGLDYREFDPVTDKLIKKNYSAGNLGARAENKVALQKEFSLEVNPDKPLMAFWGRLDTQKGIDLIQDVIRFVLEEFDVQLVVVGPAEPGQKDFFLDLEKKYPGRVGTHLMFDPILPRQLAAGADILLHPSRYEPGGIVAIEAMRYGCVPVVRATGGLADSVANYDPAKHTGTGFTFKSFNKESFLVALVRALETYRNRDDWKRLVKRTMEQDFSWNQVAQKYVDLYRRATDFRKEALSLNPPIAFKPQD